MKMPILQICLLFIFLLDFIQFQDALATDLLSNLTMNYDKRLRPHAYGPAVEVKVQIGVVALGPFDEKRFSFEVDMYLRHWWNDPRLKFTSNSSYNYNGNAADVIWVPDIYFENAYLIRTHAIMTENQRAMLKPNGDVYASMRVTAKFSCPMDLKLYPMDTQECRIHLGSYSFSGRDLNLSWEAPALTIDTVSGKAKIPSYKLEKIITEKKVYGMGSHAESFIMLECNFRVSRSFKLHLFKVYLPSSFLVVLTWATFYIPSSSVPARITLIVTNFLATIFIMQGASSQVANVDYTTALQFFLIANVVFIMSALLEYLLVLNMANRSKQDSVPLTADIALLNGRTSEQCNNFHEDEVKDQANSETAKRSHCCNVFRPSQHKKVEKHFIDTYAKAVFPMSYFLFISIYFIYYSTVAGI